MRRIEDVNTLISTAQRRADPIVLDLLANASGPTVALLTLYVARAELLRVAQERVLASEWTHFVQHQAQLERVFDEQCDVLRAMSTNLRSLAGKGVQK